MSLKQNKYSDYKIFAFPEKVQSFRDNVLTAPIYVRIKPINRCNHACHWCVYSDGTLRPKDRPDKHLQAGMHETMREQDIMPTEAALGLIDDLADIGTKAVTFSGGGEPLLHKDIASIMQRTLDRNLALSIITNGQLLQGVRAETLAHAKWVRISMDYTSEKQMVESRNVPGRFFTGVLDNITNFTKIKDVNTDLGVNFIITRDNYEGIVDFAKQLKDCGVENIRFSPVYISGFKEYHAPIAARVVEQLLECQSFCDGNFSINTTYDLDSASKSPVRPFNRCLYAQTTCVVGADLNIYACHNTAYSKHGLIAGIQNRKFSEAWFSDEVKEWHDKFKPCNVCHHECANHNKVALYDKLTNDSYDAFV